MTILDYDTNNGPATASTAPVSVRRPAPAPQVWLNDGPATRLGALLHTEVGHAGRCYTARAVRTTPFAVLLAAGGTLAHAAAQHWHDGGGGEALARWPGVTPLTAVAVLLAALAACAGWAVLGHLLWHRDEAPYAGNEVLDLGPEVPRG
ncbi:MAG: hypothetical protein V7603_5024 [Micromonosporaceae bacterium]